MKCHCGKRLRTLFIRNTKREKREAGTPKQYYRKIGMICFGCMSTDIEALEEHTVFDSE